MARVETELHVRIYGDNGEFITIVDRNSAKIGRNKRFWQSQIDQEAAARVLSVSELLSARYGESPDSWLHPNLPLTDDYDAAAHDRYYTGLF